MDAQDRADKRAEKKRMEDKRVKEDDEIILILYTPPRPFQAGES
jgi:hypothetical protein